MEEVKDQYGRKQCADCPDCGQQIGEYEIKAIMGAEVLNKLQEDSIMAVVNEDQSIVKCQCGNVLEVEEGKVDYNQKDEAGKTLSRKACEHMSKYRIRCPACKGNFCTK